MLPNFFSCPQRSNDENEDNDTVQNNKNRTIRTMRTAALFVKELVVPSGEGR